MEEAEHQALPEREEDHELDGQELPVAAQWLQVLHHVHTQGGQRRNGAALRRYQDDLGHGQDRRLSIHLPAAARSPEAQQHDPNNNVADSGNDVGERSADAPLQHLPRRSPRRQAAVQQGQVPHRPQAVQVRPGPQVLDAAESLRPLPRHELAQREVQGGGGQDYARQVVALVGGAGSRGGARGTAALVARGAAAPLRPGVLLLAVLLGEV
mmetsp:Transcript_77922/g.215382  ORF Transcript_77922/g.215382 Transcript_77922/m.215382 type:complete len:211 (-) Transcript_77922:389-1021(-)